MSRDLALIAAATAITVCAIVCITLLVSWGDLPPEAALGAVAGAAGIGGVMIGRLSGANAPT